MSSNSMWRYSQFASGDALSLAAWLDHEFDLSKVRMEFDSLTKMERVDFENNNSALIEELIRRTEGQRSSFLRRVGKNASKSTKALLIVFGIIGLQRVRAVIEVRDRLMSIGPGSAYRVTNSRFYNIQGSVLNALLDLVNYDWPELVFAQYSGD